jgi:hypothetical protein
MCQEDNDKDKCTEGGMHDWEHRFNGPDDWVGAYTQYCKKCNAIRESDGRDWYINMDEQD